jgi:transposase
MVDIEFIRKKHFLEGWSIRRLSRQLQLARQTVRKALASSAPPRYHLRQPRPCPAMDPYRALIEGWLAADAQAPPKQRHTAKRIYDRLSQEHQFHGGESTVRRYVARLRAKPAEVFIPLSAAFGQQAQVDWGQAQVKIAGVPIVAHLFCLRLRASGVPFAWAAPTEKLEAFLDGHCRAFTWLGGIPAECLYDNPKTAVVRILAGPAREEHTLFSSLRAHYLFESIFCRPAQAHEKGSVENLVGYVRRNALVPVPDFPSWEALNAHLLAWCAAEQGKRANAWAQERRHLRPLPLHPFRPALLRLAPVSRLSLVSVDRNRYSVPCAYVGRTVQLALFTERLEISHQDTLLARHPRC